MGTVEKLKEYYDIEDTWLGMEIHPETPAEGSKLEDKFEPSYAKQMIGQLNSMGRQYDISFGNMDLIINTHNALQAAEYARERNLHHEYHNILMRSYFSEGVDISNIENLLRLGEEVGLDREGLKDAIINKRYEDKLQKDSKTAHEYGINSTPTFIINDKYSLVGAQPFEKFKEVFDYLINNEGK